MDQSTIPEDQRYYTMPGSWNPCVDEDLFYQCQAIVDKNREIRHNSITVSEITPFIFSGLMYCDCGKQMVCDTSRRPKSIKKYGSGQWWIYHYYRCKSCKRLLKSSVLEEAVDNLANDLLSKGSTVLKDAYVNYEAELQQHNKQATEQIAIFTKGIAKYNAEKDKLVNAITKVNDPDTLKELNDKLKVISATIRDYKETLEAWTSYKDDKESFDIFKEFLDLRLGRNKDFNTMSAKDKKRVVNTLFTRITVKEDHVEAQLKTSDIISLQFGQNKALSGQMGG
jgi:hypothetical protein